MSARARSRSRATPRTPAACRQLARTAPGADPSVPVATPEVRYEEEDSHEHFHLKRAMRYSLWNEARTAQVAPAQKVGFCLYDLEDAPGFSATGSPLFPVYNDDVTHYCEQGDPASTSLRMGVSAGWRDVYGQALAYQWIDVSDTPPGTYVVGAEADPDNVLWEGGGAAEVNAPAFAQPDRHGARLGRAAGRHRPDRRDPGRPAVGAEVRRPDRRQPALPRRRRPRRTAPSAWPPGPGLPRERAAPLHPGSGLRGAPTRSPTSPARSPRASRPTLRRRR